MIGAYSVARTMVAGIVLTTAPVIVQPVTQEKFSGGWDYWKNVRQGKTKKDIEEERIRLGITVKVAKIIDNVVEGLLSDPDQNTKEELQYQLKLQAIRYETKYMKAFNHQYQMLLKDEIAYRLAEIQEDEDVSILLLTI